MLLHDSFFYSSNLSINGTHYTSITMTHSPLFHSTLTLILSAFGVCSNLICLIYLCIIISEYTQRKLKKSRQIEQQKSIHILSHKKYRFLVILTTNDFLLCLASIISCLDEKYYSQSLVAYYHLCSFHILIWKFTLHLTPLLTIFILCRYYYISNKSFPSKYVNTTALTQLLCTDLCSLIPFVIALAWSVDGLWLWGDTDIKTYATPTISGNQTNEIQSISTINGNLDQSNIKLNKSYDNNNNNFDLPKQKLICYLQTNDNLDFTARLLYLIQTDFVLLFSLHFIGLFLEIFLHIRLCCCLIARKITPTYLREQQLSLYISYMFICLTLTSLPFYFYRTIEILFDLHLSNNYSDPINSRILAQIILFGTSFKPLLYLLLICPSKILFRFKCYTSIKIEAIDQFDDLLVINQLNDQQQNRSYSLKLSTWYPKIRINTRTLSSPVISTNNYHSMNSNRNQNRSYTAHI